MRKKFRNIKQFKPKRKIHKKKVSMMVVSSALASALFLTPIAPIVENGQFLGFEQEKVDAATLAEVGILTDTTINANIGNEEGPGPYNLDLSLTGTGLADVDVVGTDQVALFYAPDLAGDLGVDGNANVQVEILPVTVEDLPALNIFISDLTSTLTGTVSSLVGTIDSIIDMVPDSVLEVNGLENLRNSVEALNNVDQALTDLLAYEDIIPATVNNENGTITVDFSDGLDNHLETVVEDVVLKLLDDVKSAAQELDVQLVEAVPVVGDIVNGLIDEALGLATNTIIPAVNEAVNEISSEAVDLTGDLASAQVIGNTEVTVPATIDRNTNVSGEIPVFGAGIGTNLIDLELLNTLNTETTIEIPSADTTAPVITPIENVDVTENLPIDGITVETDEPSEIAVEGLPEGIAYDPETQTINGIPVIEDWEQIEEERAFNVTVTATDDAGNSSEETFEINVQRDTDGDGNPDVTDPDDDGDGYTDEEEEEAGTDPKDDGSVPGTEITPIAGINEITDQTVVENEVIEDVIVEAEDPEAVVSVDETALPEGLTFDAETNTISGTPVVTDWGETEETRELTITITAENPDGSSASETFTVTVQRDTDGDGNPDVTDPDDDGDGYTDEEEEEAGTDPKDDSEVPSTEITPIAGINEIADQTVVENEAIEDVIVEAEDPEAVVSVDEATLPEGLMFDAETNTISGTPAVTDWGEAEETRELTITITAENPDGSSASETFTVTVQRDTDGDGTPDVTDPDDDGDGYTDEEEEEAGTDPKDDSEVPGTEITPIGGINEISDQTVVEYEAIEEVQIVPEDPEAVVSVDETALPEGLTFDAETNTISGTPVVTDWGETEETRELTITITAENPDGSSASETFTVTVQRDTDGDGNPDVTDLDDDGDGYTDEEEEEAGTDPKDDTDTPNTTAPVITPIEDVMAVEGQPIENITVETDEPSEIVVDGLPDGTAYDPETQIISGTPVIEDWDDTEEERVFEITITATDEAGNTSTETFEMIIQRDTDSNGDSDPGVTDPDDEQDEDSGNNDSNNDGSGEEDGEKDTTPPVITPIPDGSGIENEPIEDIVIETDEPSQIIVEGLPDGVTYDPETGIISGTPTINDWSEGETKRTYTVTITAEDEAGNRSSIDFNLTIERDLNRTGGAEDNLDTKGGQSVLPKTGETQNIFTSILGIFIASIGALLFFWSKKEKA